MSRYLLFLFCVHFILRALHVLKSSRGLCPHVSSFFFSIVITSLGEEGASLCASRAFVCFVRVSFCHFSLPLGVGGWLWYVKGALPGLFY